MNILIKRPVTQAVAILLTSIVAFGQVSSIAAEQDEIMLSSIDSVLESSDSGVQQIALLDRGCSSKRRTTCGSSVPDCGCGVSDCCCPSWTGRIGYVHLWRERTGSDFAVWEDTANNPLYTADRFDFESESGIDTSIVWDNGCGRGMVVRYLGLEEFTAAETTDDFGLTSRIVTNPRSDSYGPGFNFDFRYESEFQSFEALRQRCCGQRQVTYGFRYIDLDEELSIRAVQSGATYLFRTQNELYGLQFGLDDVLWEAGRFGLDGTAKAGVYYNDAQGRSQYSVTSSSGQASDDRTAFVGEFGLAARYQLSCCLTLRAGYQLLFLDGVALSDDQVPNTGALNAFNNTNVPVTIDSSSLLYHGLNVGVEFRR